MPTPAQALPAGCLSDKCSLCKRGVTADTARLATFLDTSERFWLGLHADFDLEEAHRTLCGTARKIEWIGA